MCGTLYGQSLIDTIEVTNSYYLPHFDFDISEGEDQQEFKEIVQKDAIEKHAKYYKTNKEIFVNESFVGLFVTVSPDVQKDISKVLQSFRDKKRTLFAPIQNLQQPFIITIDPTMKSGNLGLKVLLKKF
jgi:hypothetical protein